MFSNVSAILQITALIENDIIHVCLRLQLCSLDNTCMSSHLIVNNATFDMSGIRCLHCMIRKWSLNMMISRNSTLLLDEATTNETLTNIYRMKLLDFQQELVAMGINGDVSSLFVTASEGLLDSVSVTCPLRACLR